MRRFSILSLAIAAIGCTETAPSAPQMRNVAASANTMIANEKQPIELVVTACNGETVVLSGNVHTRFRLTTTKSGNVSAALSADYNLSGIGAVTLARYNGSLSIRDQELATNNVSGFSHRTSMRLVGQGNVPNSVQGFTIHVVVANGAVRVEHMDVTSRCEP